MSSTDWEFGERLSSTHAERLLAQGAHAGIVRALDVREVIAPLPDWWQENGNALYAMPGNALPYRIIRKLTGLPCVNTLLVVATDAANLSSLLVSGSGATIFLGPDSELTAGDIYCGEGSSVIVDGGLTATRAAVVDARNGGSITAKWGQLWAANVYVATDDMHRLECLETGARLNPYGAHITLGKHVWLGRDAMITGNVDIGEGAVVGARSLVRNHNVAANTAVGGSPARTLRERITWREDDRP